MSDKKPALKLTRAQETELPHQVEIGFTDGEIEYRRAAVASRRLSGSSRREARADAAIVTRRAEAQRLADAWLQDLWAGRETRRVRALASAHRDRAGRRRVAADRAGPQASSGRAHRRRPDAQDHDARGRAGGLRDARRRRSPRPAAAPAARARQAAGGRSSICRPRIGDPTRAAIYRGRGRSMARRRRRSGARRTARASRPHRILDLPAIIGATRRARCSPGPLWRWDPKCGPRRRDLVRRDRARSTTRRRSRGGNLFAVRGADGRWEIFSAARAELIGERSYRLSRLLRGLAGSEAEAARSVAGGRLDRAPRRGGRSADQRSADLGQTWRYRIGPAGRDHADPALSKSPRPPAAMRFEPLAPVRIRGAAGSRAAIRLAWLRRTRRRRRCLGAGRRAARRETASATRSTFCADGNRPAHATSASAARRLSRSAGTRRFRRTAIRPRASHRANERGRGTRLRARDDDRRFVLKTVRAFSIHHRIFRCDNASSGPAAARRGAGAEARHPQRGARGPRRARALSVKERDRTNPPGSPAEGDRYLVGDGGHGRLRRPRRARSRVFDLGAWRFFAPRAGWQAYVEAEDIALCSTAPRGATLACRRYRSISSGSASGRRPTTRTALGEAQRGALYCAGAERGRHGRSALRAQQGGRRQRPVPALSERLSAAAPKRGSSATTISASASRPMEPMARRDAGRRRNRHGDVSGRCREHGGAAARIS